MGIFFEPEFPSASRDAFGVDLRDGHMKFDGNFLRYGQLDESALRLCVEQQSEAAWRADQFRQKKFDVHTDTETLYLIYDQDFRHVNPTKLPLFDVFAAALQPIFDTIAARLGGDGWIVRCIIARLCSGGRVNLHRDHGFSLTRARRFHIPIMTNLDVHFTVGDETVHMRPGEIWEINNVKRHGVVNSGAKPRIHLILDWAQPVTRDDLQGYVEDQKHDPL